MRWNSLYFAAALVTTTLVIVHVPAYAAPPSFDCQLAKTPTEKAICANPNLTALDDQIAAAFRIKMQHRSPAERYLLLDDQRGWLRRRDETCGKRPDADLCLERFYKGRLAEIQSDADITPLQSTKKGDYVTRAYDSPSPVYVGNPAEGRADFSETIRQFRSNDSFVSCSLLLEVPRTKYETGLGGICKLHEKSGKYVQVLVCNDTAVGNSKLVSTGDAVASKADLAHFIADNCSGG